MPVGRRIGSDRCNPSISMAYTKAPDADLLQAALIGYQWQQVVLEERIAEIRREPDGTAV